MKDDDCSGDQVFSNEPTDVPHWRMDGVVRVRGAQNAFVAVRSSKAELPRPRDAAGRAEEFRFCFDADRSLGLLKVAQKVGIRVEQD